MYHDFTYEATLAASLRAQWNLDEVMRADQDLDFSRNFLPANLAGTDRLTGVTDDERRTLNQICAYEYLFLFGTFEEFVVPFVMAHVGAPSNEPQIAKDKALHNFAEEEKKHIHLFERYRAAFDRGFPVRCKLINASAVLPKAMNLVHPLSGALFVLLFEWMTQSHYVDSVRDDTEMDPLFKSLLKNHWIEEAQHAKLDTLIADDLARNLPRAQLGRVLSHFIELFVFVNNSLRIQARFNVDTFEEVIKRPVANRNQLIAHLHRVAMWTFVGCGLVHPRFRATLQSISPEFGAKVDAWTAKQFAPEIRRMEAARPPARRMAAPA